VERKRTRLANPGEGAKFCPECDDGNGAYLSIDSFANNKARHDNLQAQCRDCQANDGARKERKATYARAARKRDPLKGYRQKNGRELIDEFLSGDSGAGGDALAEFLKEED
jgi:hypothetical protein